jgi:hypothetical protein
MIGANDFIRYYDWTFEYLRRRYGEAAVEAYWAESIAFNSQNHANVLIRTMGLQGMAEYWGHTLDSEAAGYRTQLAEGYFRIDMYHCPSKGMLTRLGQQEYHDYCQHCMGWIRPIMDGAGFVIDHEHNHAGQCWWEMYPSGQRRPAPAAPPLRDDQDVRLRPGWRQAIHDRWLASGPASVDDE